MTAQVHIFRIELANGEKSDPIDVNKTIPISDFKRFRRMLMHFVRVRHNREIILHYKEL